MIKLKEILQNGNKVKLEGIETRTEFASFQDFLNYTTHIENLLCSKLTYIINYEGDNHRA